MTQAYSGVDNLEVMRGAKRYQALLIDLVTSAVPRGVKRVVDFGAGLGTYADELAARGFEVICIENDPGLAHDLHRRGFAVYDQIEAVPANSQTYVYSLNVLEHINNDAAVAAQLSASLAPGGTLLLYLPAFQSLFSSMDKKVGHYRRYKLGPTVKLLQDLGLEVVTKRYVDSLGFVITLLFKLIGNSNGDINPTALRLYDQLVLPLSLALDHLTARFFGKNLMIVARKPVE